MDCPICLESSEDLVAGPCGHGLCLQCADTLLLKRQHCRQAARSAGVEVLPTLGQCPLCREELLYFDLTFKNSQEKVFPGDQIDENLIDIAYVGKLGVGWTSLHLAEGGDASNSYIHGPDDKQMKLVNLRYHGQSHTLAFQMQKPDCGELSMSGVLTFSDNFSFIARGVLRRLNAIQPSKLDGVWKRESLSDVIVFNQQCMVIGADGEDARCLGQLCSDGNSISLVVHPQGQSVEESEKETWDADIDLDQLDGALSAGTSLLWKRPGSSTIIETWIFDRALPPEATESIPISGQNGELYWRLGLSEPPLPSYHAETLEPNVFVQHGNVGVASYHFGIDRSYISYEGSYAATQWPPLDNGQPIPARMDFSNVQIDKTLFRGEIDWMGTHGTTWNSARRWIYEIRFDDGFHCAVGGSVRFENNNDGSGQSEFGKDLIYINAALFSNETSRENLDFQRLQQQGASPATLATILRISQQPVKPLSFLM